MAAEITVSMLLSMLKSGVAASLQDPTPPALAQFNMAGSSYVQEVMSVPTTAGGTAIPLGSIVTPGWFAAINLDPTNYVTVLSAVAGTALVKLKAGEPCLFRFSTAVPAMLANTAPCRVQFLLLDN